MTNTKEYLYEIEKLELHEGKDSMLPPGFKQQGHTIGLFRYYSDERKAINTVDEVDVDWQLVMTRGLTEWMNTSLISEIVERGENYVVFRTQTSVYKLTQREKPNETP